MGLKFTSNTVIGKFLKNDIGALAPLTAVMLPLLVGITGVGVDVSFWMAHQRDMQTAADAAAIAGAYELGNGFDEARAIEAGLKEAVNNGYENVDVNTFTMTFGETDDGNQTVAVEITSKENKYFSQVLHNSDIYSNAAAASAVILQEGGYCLLSLDEDDDGAITAVGAVDIESAGCGIAVNSDSNSALDLSGNVDIDIADLSIVGNMDVSGSVDLNAGTTKTGAPPAKDPYEDVDVPDSFDPTDCDENNFSIPPVPPGGEMDPGTYCGGITISGNVDITMNPGVYYLVDGDFRVTGSGSITATGVTIVLTHSGDPDDTGNLDVSGSKDMFFEAPADGDLSGDEEQFEGISFFQDREAPNDGSCNSLVGTSALDLTGAAYFPSRCLDIGGNADDNNSQGAVCSRIIANTIRLHGNPNLGNDCDGVDLPASGDFIVRLIQ